MIPIDVLVRPVTSDDIYEKALDMLEVVKIPARSWRDGGVAKTLLSILAEIGAIGAGIVTFIVKMFFLVYAEKDGLTAHALDVYDVERLPATFAAGKVKLTNKGGAPFTRGANEVIVYSTNTNARFRITEAFTLGSGSESSPTTIEVSVSAIDAGSASTVAPAEIDDFETPLSPRVSVTNETSIIGRDEETDDQLRKRCSLKKGTWSPYGPRDAYEYAALTAKLPDGSPTSITRVWVSPYSSTGQVTVVCATASGTPSAAELLAVREEIERTARPDSVICDVIGATPVSTPRVVTLWARGGVETVVKTNANAALAKLYADYPIGGLAKTDGGQGYVYLDAIAGALTNSSPQAFDVDFPDGATDELIGPTEVAVNATTVTVRVL